MTDPSRLSPARHLAEQLSRARAHAEIAALVRESLESLRRSELALEAQLGDLRCYLGHEGVAPDMNPRAN
jgi:hypothetical protein